MDIRPRRLFEYFEILWRRKWLIFFMTITMLIATYMEIRRVPYLYESRALISVSSMDQGMEGAQPPGFNFSAVVNQLKSRTNLAELGKRYQLYPLVENREFVGSLLDKAIVVETKNRNYYPEGPESVSIAFKYYDKQATHDVVRDLVAVFEQANQNVRQYALGELERVQGSLGEVESRLKQIASQQQIASLRAQAANRINTDSAVMRTQRFAVESSIDSLSDREYSLEKQISEVKRLIVEQEKIVRDASSRGGTGNAAYGALLVKKSELDAQLKIYLTQYTEKNPKVITLKEQINEINRQMTKLVSGDGSGTGGLPLNAPEMVELRKLESDLSRLETDLEVTRRDLKRKSTSLVGMPEGRGQSDIGFGGPVVDESLSAGKTEYDRLAVRYSTLVDREDKLKKLSGISGAGALMYRVIDPANMPTSPVSPNPILLMIAAFGLSVCFSLVIAVIVELPRLFVLSSERDVEYFLGTQVLALIPETLTPVEKVRSRRLRLTRNLLMMLVLAVLVPALFFILAASKIFQILGSR